MINIEIKLIYNGIIYISENKENILMLIQRENVN